MNYALLMMNEHGKIRLQSILIVIHTPKWGLFQEVIAENSRMI